MRSMLLCLLVISCGDPAGRAAPGDSLAVVAEPLLPIFAGGTTGRHIVCTVGDSTCVPAMALLQQMRPDLLIANHCREGSQTPEILDHQWAKNSRAMQNCDVVVTLGGINDISANLPIEQSIGRLTGIADEATALGIDAYVMVTIPYRIGQPYGATVQAKMDQLQAGLRGALLPVHVVDLHADFQAHQEYYLGGSDWIHPGELGQAHIAGALADAIP